MTEQWELDQYEKACKKIKPTCVEKGDVVMDVGSPFNTAVLTPFYYRATMCSDQIRMSEINDVVGISMYVDSKWDENFDVKVIIPYFRYDTNGGGGVQFKLRVYAYSSDGSEEYDGYNVENEVGITFPDVGYNCFGKYQYLLRSENIHQGDIVSIGIVLNQSDRDVRIYAWEITYKKKRE
ncbi:MAG: hypothetical protein EU529_05905 [Promethearchaeota archaeon]|nr:MAG: hypothetical protein EU529_05905 [Candidatus Lokiarchaeota archaeon]